MTSNIMINPYNTNESKKKQVEQMFDNIAFRYDFLNHFLSVGIDRLWRKKTIKKLESLKPMRILDIATGTGDLAISMLKLKPMEITGIDISEEMLAYGRNKIKKLGADNIIHFEKGDGEQIAFPDDTFDAVSVAFGVRNFENLQKGLKEVFRVLKPSGMFVILEFSKPRNKIFRFFYYVYFFKLVPLFGKLFSRDHRAYSYLPESVNSFPSGDDFIKLLINAGFAETDKNELTFGIATIYTREKILLTIL